MTNHFVNSADKNLAFNKKKEFVSNYWTVWHIGAGIGLLGGTILLACATFLTAFQFVYGEIPHGSWLFALVLPLWAFGAHCFDKNDDLEKARRNEFYKNIEQQN